MIGDMSVLIQPEIGRELVCQLRLGERRSLGEVNIT